MYPCWSTACVLKIVHLNEIRATEYKNIACFGDSLHCNYNGFTLARLVHGWLLYWLTHRTVVPTKMWEQSTKAQVSQCAFAF